MEKNTTHSCSIMFLLPFPFTPQVTSILNGQDVTFMGPTSQIVILEMWAGFVYVTFRHTGHEKMGG